MKERVRKVDYKRNTINFTLDFSIYVIKEAGKQTISSSCLEKTTADLDL